MLFSRSSPLFPMPLVEVGGGGMIFPRIGVHYISLLLLFKNLTYISQVCHSPCTEALIGISRIVGRVLLFGSAQAYDLVCDWGLTKGTEMV